MTGKPENIQSGTSRASLAGPGGLQAAGRECLATFEPAPKGRKRDNGCEGVPWGQGFAKLYAPKHGD